MAALLQKYPTLAYEEYSAALLIRKARRLANGSRPSAWIFSCALPSRFLNGLPVQLLSTGF
jgi:hypothetical protein